MALSCTCLYLRVVALQFFFCFCYFSVTNGPILAKLLSNIYEESNGHVCIYFSRVTALRCTGLYLNVQIVFWSWLNKIFKSCGPSMFFLFLLFLSYQWPHFGFSS